MFLLNTLTCFFLSLVIFVVASPVYAQDLEPRRWTPVPLDVQLVGIGYAKSAGDITFDPVLLIEDVKSDVDILGVSYVNSFKLFNKLARFDAMFPMANGSWEGLVDGVETKVSRKGLFDPKLRVSVNLLGTPVTNAKGMRNYLADKKSNTVVGAALSLSLPLGNYYSDKLINLGENRYTLRPQLGVVHTSGKWSYELTGSVFIHSDNKNFYNGKVREQDPLYAIQGHVIYSLNAGKWLSLSTGYGAGGKSTVDNESKDDKKHMLLSALSFGMPVSRSQSIKIAYVNGKTNSPTGTDSNSLFVSFSQLF